jgi:hypothetical protein
MTTPDAYYVKSDFLNLDMQHTDPVMLKQIECLWYFRAPAVFIIINEILLSSQMVTILGCLLSRCLIIFS